MVAKLRFAKTDEDRGAIYRFRYELYVEGQGLFQDEADHERRWLYDEYDAHSHLLLAEVDGKVVATTRLTCGTDVVFSDETRETYELDRFINIVGEAGIAVATRLLVSPDYRGTDLSGMCMYAIFELAANQGIEIALANCEAHLVNRYWKVGFRAYGGLYNHPTNGVLVRIALLLGDMGYMRQVKSPFIPALSKKPTPTSEEMTAQLRAALTQNRAVVSKLGTSTADYTNELSRWLNDGVKLCGLLNDLELSEARILLDMSHILSCNPGDAIIRKGHVSRTLYMLLSGSLEVRDESGLVARLEERGAMVGEVAFFTSGARMSDVIVGPKGARVLALSDRTLRELIASHGPVAAKFLHFVARGLCEKLRGQAAVEQQQA